MVPIGSIVYTPGILTVNAESPFRKLEDFISYAREHPEKLSFGSAGVGGSIHLNMEIFMSRCGIKLNHVPFGGGAQSMTAVMGGHIDCHLGSISSVGPHVVPGGKLRALTVFSRERLSQIPDVPTCIEKGYNVDRGFWHYLAVAKGTPQPILDILQAVFNKTADDPQVKEALIRTGYVPVKLNPEETAKKVNEEFDLARQVFVK